MWPEGFSITPITLPYVADFWLMALLFDVLIGFHFLAIFWFRFQALFIFWYWLISFSSSFLLIISFLASLSPLLHWCLFHFDISMPPFFDWFLFDYFADISSFHWLLMRGFSRGLVYFRQAVNYWCRKVWKIPHPYSLRFLDISDFHFSFRH